MREPGRLGRPLDRDVNPGLDLGVGHLGVRIEPQQPAVGVAPHAQQRVHDAHDVQPETGELGGSRVDQERHVAADHLDDGAQPRARVLRHGAGAHHDGVGGQVRGQLAVREGRSEQRVGAEVLEVGRRDVAVVLLEQLDSGLRIGSLLDQAAGCAHLLRQGVRQTRHACLDTSARRKNATLAGRSASRRMK